MTQTALFEPDPDPDEDERTARERHRGARVLPRGYRLGRCRYGCTERTAWVKLVDALGKPKTNSKGFASMLLVNLGTVPDGNVELVGAGRARMLSPREYRDPDAELYEPHARTCRKQANPPRTENTP